MDDGPEDLARAQSCIFFVEHGDNDEEGINGRVKQGPLVQGHNFFESILNMVHAEFRQVVPRGGTPKRQKANPNLSRQDKSGPEVDCEVEDLLCIRHELELREVSPS